MVSKWSIHFTTVSAEKELKRLPPDEFLRSRTTGDGLAYLVADSVKFLRCLWSEVVGGGGVCLVGW